MASFSVRWAKDAEAELLKVPFPVRRQLNHRLVRLKDAPFPRLPDDRSWERIGGGPPENVRLRVHGWTVLYQVDEEAATVRILALRPDQP